MLMDSNDSELLGVKRMTISQLREITGDKTISNEEAEEIIDSLVKLSLIAYEMNNNS